MTVSLVPWARYTQRDTAPLYCNCDAVCPEGEGVSITWACPFAPKGLDEEIVNTMLVRDTVLARHCVSEQ